MNIFKKLIIRQRAEERADTWSGIQPIGQPILATPDMEAKLRDPANRNEPIQRSILALAAINQQHPFTSLPEEGFLVFELSGDATIVCKMTDATSRKIDRTLEFFVEAVEMPTYPVLRLCLEWDRVQGGNPLTFESTPDLQDIDFQRFLSALLKAGKVWIHAVNSDASISILSTLVSFDRDRVGYYKGEVEKATRYFRNLAKDKRNYRQAMEDFYKARPMH
jgi:hypothetical protein